MKLFSGRRILYLLFALLLLVGGAALSLEQFLRVDTHKEQIVAELSSLLHRKVSYRTGDFTLRYGPSFTFTGITISERDSSTQFLQADRLTLRIALFPLLEKKIIIKALDLDAPRIIVTRYRDGSFSLSDLLEQQQPSSVNLQIRGITVRKGTIIYTDGKASPEGLTIVLSQTDLVLGRLSRGKKGGVSFSAQLGDGQHSWGSLSVKGKVRPAPAGTTLDHSELDLEIVTNGLDASPFWPYYRTHVPFKKIEGRLTTNSSFQGELRRFTAKGSLKIAGGRFDYQPIFHAILEPKLLNAMYTLELSRDKINVSALDATVDGVRIKGSCAISDLTTGDPRIVAKATSTPIRLEEFSRYIPYGVIVHEPSEFIEQKIKGGTLRVLDGSLLDGKVSQILTMEKGTNYKVLAIRGMIEKGIVDWGDGVPLFTDLKGELELAGKDFNLKKMTGRFGLSPFTLDGALRDYCMETPTLYHFVMAMTPSSLDSAWLFRMGKEKPAVLTGKSVLQLTGDGPTKSYNLSGSWDLGQAAYTLPGILTKPAGMANTASFRLEFTPDRALLKDAQFILPPLSARGTAEYHYQGEQKVGFTLFTNQFSLGSLAPLAPRISGYQPRGNVQLSLRGTQPATPASPMNLSGTVTMTGGSLVPHERMKPLTEINGSATFTGSQLETSLISAKLGSTALYGKGTLRNFDKPVVGIAFSSPLMDPADLGLKSSDRAFRPSRVQGSLTIQDQSLRIASFSTQINNTSLAITGTIQDLRHPRADLTVISSHLELDDILALTRLEPENPLSGGTGKPSLKLSLKAESGKLKEVLFEKLFTEIIYEDGILYLQPLEFQALGGTVTSKLRVDTTGEAARYQVNYELRRVSSQGLLKSLGVKKQELWGTLSAQGELNARGNSADELKKSLLGSLSFHIDNGSIRRFASLAKIFSILNVSQLLKMHLPEMTSGGMPFSEITGTVAIRDGVLTTNDLFVKSEAMNISAIGTLNIPRNALDVIVGVQPLQAVDKVINRIPIVGWILTGKDKSWITSYFEVSGTPGDPHVSVKTVSSMATGVVNIFKRLFQLPAKLFTDTGAVILGQ
jgi:uncharacterized protein involved in outer membrane biogenesis